MKRIAVATICAVPITVMSLVLTSCDPMYRFKFTRFAFVSDMLAGNPTKVDHVKEGDLEVRRVARPPPAVVFVPIPLTSSRVPDQQAAPLLRDAQRNPIAPIPRRCGFRSW